MNQTIQKVIAIDGPAGSGKSTIAKKLANILNITYIDTGSMFRSIGVYQKKHQIENLGQVVSSFEMNYIGKENHLIEINGIDMTHEIRDAEAGKLASIVSQVPEVRSLLAQVQRDLVTKNYSVMEGRDLGTVIFPHAFIKVYLTASIEERALRRQKELEQKGEPISFEEIKKQIVDRDYNDMNREIAPLKKAQDAIEIDTTGLSLEEIVSQIVDIFNKRKK